MQTTSRILAPSEHLVCALTPSTGGTLALQTMECAIDKALRELDYELSESVRPEHLLWSERSGGGGAQGGFGPVRTNPFGVRARRRAGRRC